jgi:ethanolamine utilization cobalamin adenosyltransferase
MLRRACHAGCRAKKKIHLEKDDILPMRASDEATDKKARSALLSPESNLRLANEKATEGTIKKLTRGNPTRAVEFADLKGSDILESE